MKNNWLICIAGPTAVGKTKLAIKLAQYYKTEIISADSRQFYNELNIGVARPNKDELHLVKHHFIGHLSIHDYYSAGDFERDAEQKLEEIFLTNNIAIAVGGSGLYLKALTEGLNEMPKVDTELRNNLTQLYHEKGLTALQQKLLSINPLKYHNLDINNPQRLMRAIELSLQAVEFGSNTKTKKYNSLLFVLNTSREELYKQINLRVDNMIKNGLIDEAKKMYAFKHLNALKTVGYNEMFEFFEGQLNLEQAIDKIKQHTRNYAKKQLTWFSKQKNAIFVEPADYENIISIINAKILSK